MNDQPPISAYQEVCGMKYFPRMLDKIRKYAAGELREDFHHHLGIGLDGRTCQFLRIDYQKLKEKTLAGGSDEEIFQWCDENGRQLDENDKIIWNGFVSKIGWKDQVTESLIERKKSSGLEDRDEIQTMVEYFEYDEGRKS
ncbi:DUF5069 domain-containing protein [Puniceicoccus vermicola]|uniref:DUF5069 domain-containing protein n=1 Tax=Puniceicoccus vermicola TaxID=388746 RepID=A0A7X1E322_9BACT|nr:DUF5069 domain-containing protein [Puniceicoccus vermicola]MBC2600514.1 DUF5069 domain-containing protein [Puniceicoccus vermicola]